MCLGPRGERHAGHGQGQRLRVTGFGHGVSKDDYLILPNGAETSRYGVENIT